VLLPVKRRLLENLACGGAMLLLGLVCATYLAKSIAMPLQQLGADAALLQRGELQHRSSVRQIGEVGQLATALNRMADSLQSETASMLAIQTQLRLITDNLPGLISYLGQDRRFQFANSVYETWLGLDSAALLGKSLEEVYGADSYARFRHHIDAGLKGTRVVYERDLHTLAGQRRVEVTLVPHAPSGEGVKGLFVLMQDVTANREAVALHLRSEERLALALEGAGTALFDWDIANDRLYHSAQAAAMRGEPAREQTTSADASVWESMHADDRAHCRKLLRAVIVGETEQYDAEFRIETRAGNWLWVRSKGRVMERSEAGRALRMTGTYADISARKLAEERLRLLAEFDPLTGLPNRALFHDRLSQAMARIAPSGKTTAVLFLDIDHFKQVNDTLGHEAGDGVLADFARNLQASVRASDTVARLAGDEFTIILEELRSRADAEMIAASLVEKSRRRIERHGRNVAISTSIGIAFLRPGEVDAAAVLRRADAALYAAKRAGRDAFATETSVEPDLVSVC
jgi:diguanylate cyclase (GGDEF)-like protein/PAS domain S-box-containing protein